MARARRRAMVAMMGVPGTAAGGAFTVPAHGLGGAWGLGVLFTLCLGAIALTWRALPSGKRG